MQKGLLGVGTRTRVRSRVKLLSVLAQEENAEIFRRLVKLLVILRD